LRLLAVLFAGAASGAILGACIATDTERKVRGPRAPWGVFPNSSVLGIVANHLFQLTLLGIAVLIVSVGTLRLADAYPLSLPDRYVLAIALFVGAAVAKWFRYRYWKARDPWS
jgi:hypothetical protein